MKHIFASVFLTLPTIAAADSFQCHGTEPEWQLRVEDAQAEFIFPAPTQMGVALETRAEGQDWPRAYTLIGDRDTAILLLEHESCEEFPMRGHVMTQRAQTPILLTGCCSVSP